MASTCSYTLKRLSITYSLNFWCYSFTFCSISSKTWTLFTGRQDLPNSLPRCSLRIAIDQRVARSKLGTTFWRIKPSILTPVRSGKAPWKAILPISAVFRIFQALIRKLDPVPVGLTISPGSQKSQQRIWASSKKKIPWISARLWGLYSKDIEYRAREGFSLHPCLHLLIMALRGPLKRHHSRSITNGSTKRIHRTGQSRRWSMRIEGSRTLVKMWVGSKLTASHQVSILRSKHLITTNRKEETLH